MGTRLLGDPAGAPSKTPPVHVLQGEVDAIIDARRTTERIDERRARGVPIDLVVYPGLGHDMSPALLADWRALLHAGLDDATAAPSRR
jgi:phospholipase/carboxylesterase